MVVIKDNIGSPLYHYDTVKGVHYDLNGNHISREKAEMTTYKTAHTEPIPPKDRYIIRGKVPLPSDGFTHDNIGRVPMRDTSQPINDSKFNLDTFLIGFGVGVIFVIIIITILKYGVQ